MIFRTRPYYILYYIVIIIILYCYEFLCFFFFFIITIIIISSGPCNNNSSNRRRGIFFARSQRRRRRKRHSGRCGTWLSRKTYMPVRGGHWKPRLGKTGDRQVYVGRYLLLSSSSFPFQFVAPENKINNNNYYTKCNNTTQATRVRLTSADHCIPTVLYAMPDDVSERLLFYLLHRPVIIIITLRRVDIMIFWPRSSKKKNKCTTGDIIGYYEYNVLVSSLYIVLFLKRINHLKNSNNNLHFNIHTDMSRFEFRHRCIHKMRCIVFYPLTHENKKMFRFTKT